MYMMTTAMFIYAIRANRKIMKMGVLVSQFNANGIAWAFEVQQKAMKSHSFANVTNLGQISADQLAIPVELLSRS
jgi:hypothetical protein